MKARIGRPKLKAKERKEIFPLRLSALELQAIKDAAGDEPLAKWMRRTLLAAVPARSLAIIGLTALVDLAISGGKQPTKPASASKNLPQRANQVV
jgi:hypothetical protein